MPREIAKQNSGSRDHKLAVSEFFSGPLPHPKILAEYEQIQRGATHRIIAMAEKQQAHRHKLERIAMQSNVENERLGIYMSFFITTVALIIGAYLINTGKNIEGFTALVGVLGFHALNFAYQQYKEKKELEERKEENKKLK